MPFSFLPFPSLPLFNFLSPSFPYPLPYFPLPLLSIPSLSITLPYMPFPVLFLPSLPYPNLLTYLPTYLPIYLLFPALLQPNKRRKKGNNKKSSKLIKPFNRDKKEWFPIPRAHETLSLLKHETREENSLQFWTET